MPLGARPNKGNGGSHLGAVAVLSVATVFTSALGFALFQQGTPTTPVAADREPGGILLLFDQPGLAVTVDAHLSAAGDLLIRASGPTDGAKVLALFSGSADVGGNLVQRSTLYRVTLLDGSTATARGTGFPRATTEASSATRTTSMLTHPVGIL
jgi:hypothetical protein